ncbi:NAD(P)/FAD-dependent oxidoreductase [Zobellia galactanivorans]|uniref:NAD(P)/FAD-dependent oxidoreductase n=1 Tax=Zobellia galactanivorans (strain DSM 12802 / CCUG 47099 / CIP 106680 / NCIMB 13871 / Dsij) TaxID=63186 RepID=UPI0026E3DEA3|nr:NAD(P)/FAD-dependent oxidoreductase [Zobellia galactanivorans]MDO6809978.1 NAD(P)/FAD-dependent oxidoreductase [Zobellia galactanivorans]
MKIGIVGGGFMGLTLAHEIAKNNAIVKVFESDQQMGGLSTHEDYGAFVWDRFYHVILPTDNFLIELIEDLGIGDKLCWRRSYTGYYVQKKFYSISSSKEFLLFPALNLWDKAMLAFTIFYGSKIKDWKKLEKITVKDWLIKMGGRRTYEKFWSPLLLAKLGENHEKVSAVFIWTYIKRLFKARSSAAQKEHMGYVTGGYKTVFDALQKSLGEKGSEVVLNSTVEAIQPNANGGVTITNNGVEEHFDKVIVTTPLNVIERIAAPSLFEATKAKAPVEYLGVICLVLVTETSLSPYYVLNIADKEIPFTGVIGMSSLVDLDQTAGKHLTYFPKYISGNDPFWKKSDEELKSIFIAGVSKLYPDFDTNTIVSAHIHKAYRVQPLQVLNYSETIPKIKTKHNNFYVLNTSQFVNDTLNNNSVVGHVKNFMDSFKKELE